ncbi:surface protease GP63, partial [Trypanosoma theileri]
IASQVNRIAFCFSEGIPALGGSLIGKDSWCLDGESLHVNLDDVNVRYNVAAVCALVSCDESSRTVKVQYNGSDEWHNCPEGESIEAKPPTFKSGHIKCPNYTEVCTIASNGSSLITVVDPPTDPTPPPDGDGGGGGDNDGDDAGGDGGGGGDNVGDDNAGGGGGGGDNVGDDNAGDDDNAGGGGGGGGHGDGCATASPIALSALALMVITPMLLP